MSLTTSQRNRLFIGGAALALGLATIIGWRLVRQAEPPAGLPANSRFDDDSPPDPRLTFTTPFRNVRPDVGYVGDEKCAACHVDIDKSYHAHPMGRSAALAAETSTLERYDAAAHNPFAVGPYELRVERGQTAIRHHVRVRDAAGAALPEYVTPALLAIGSGTRGRSFVSLDEGACWQSPISWYSSESRWDLSPGFDLSAGGRRPIGVDCLFCHVNQVEPIALSLNRFRGAFPTGQAAIGCERCHGPGELHVAERLTRDNVDGIDTSIVNPKHLSRELQSSICAQCHLQGAQRVPHRGRALHEFRPGLPLEQFLTVFVRHPDLADAYRSVGQFEQMHQSRCFAESQGRFGCTSCHDPHGTPAPAQRIDFYRARCVSCHGANGKSCSEQAELIRGKDNNCLACHMPRASSSNIIHASITDHRLMRRPAVPQSPGRITPDTLPLLPFHVGSHLPPATQLERDLGVALGLLAARLPESNSAKVITAASAEDRLVRSVATWRTDLLAWTTLSQARRARRDASGCMAAAQRALEIGPNAEAALTEYASAAAALGEFASALGAADRLVRDNPTSLDVYLLRADIYLQMRNWPAAADDCRKALAIHPLLSRARLLLAVSLHQAGKIAEGNKEAQNAALLITDARQRTAILDWYARETNSSKR